MFSIPGKIIELLTFPGVILHHWAYQFFCKRANLDVYDVKYFQLDGESCGYVHHEDPNTFRQAAQIALGPFLVNSLAAFMLGALDMVLAAYTDAPAPQLILFWVALSFGVHALPGNKDAKQLKETARTSRTSGHAVLPIMVIPFIWLLYLANALRAIWFDFILSLAIVAAGIWVGGKLVAV